MTRAVVFAYHNVGARCFLTLLAHGIDVALVVTHQDDPNENIWFDSVQRLAAERGIPVVTPDRPDPEILRPLLQQAAPDFIFSFYYRHMIPVELLEMAPRGAFNMHGSLLPHYRGRVPVNWAVLHGEKEAGATLHEMVAKPDAGRLAGQQAVPILPDDTAFAVFNKVTVAAEICLDRCLPGLLDGSLVLQEQNLAAGSYFGGRKPEDGRIDWRQPAQAIHNLVRAVAPPYPGAFADLPAGRLIIEKTLLAQTPARSAGCGLYVEDSELRLDTTDGRVLRLLAARLGDTPLNAERWLQLHGPNKYPLPPT
jgi:methionyl-tRNA formyltransferase